MNKSLRVPLFFLIALFTVSAIYLVNQAKTGSGWEEEEGTSGPVDKYDYFRKKRLGELAAYPSGLYDLWQKKTLSKSSVDVVDSVREIGPANVGGRTRAILIDKTNVNRLIAGGISGGIWISNNRGSSWSAVNDQEMNLNVSCITQDPFQPENIYYGTGEGSGNSSAAPGAGIFKSTDGGQSFTRLLSTVGSNFEYCWSIKSSLVHTDEVYVTTDTKGMFRTKDGGQTWKKVFVTTTPIHDIETFPDGSVMIAIKSLGIYRSYTGDSGTFFKLSGGLPLSGLGRTELAYCSGSPNVVYAAISNSSDNGLLGLYRSSDTGATWQQQSNPSTGGVVSFAYTWYCLTMGVSDTDSDRVFIGSVTPAYTTNGGFSWTKAFDTHADYHVVISHPSDPNNFIVGNDGGIHQYGWTNPFTQHTTLNNGLNITQYYHGCYAPSGLTVLGGTQDNGSQYSLNAALNAKKVMGADGAYAQINQQSPTTAYASSQNGNIRRTFNINASNPSFSNVMNELDADSDNDIDEGAWFINPYFINPQNGSQMFFPTRRRLWRSTDGADSWQQVTNTLNVSTTQECYTVGLSAGPDPTAFLGGSGGLFYRINKVLTDVPGTEKSIRNSEPIEVKQGFISCIRVHPRYKNIIFVSLSNYSDKPRIWKVTKADADTPVWTSISGNLPPMLPVGTFDLHPDNPDSVILAGTDFGLYITKDGGNTWEKDTRIPNVVIDMLTIRPSDRKAFIFTHGRGTWVAHLKQLPNPFVSAGPATVKQDMLKVYPNPAADWISIEHASLLGKELKLSFYNAEGKQVLETTVTGGKKTDITTLPAGVYVVTARHEEKLYFSKLIKN